MRDDRHLQHGQDRKAYLACALLFAALGLMLVWANWPMIRAAGNEAADFAANSLLIQDAKRLHLVYGNYSRVGFHHPGPAILYVQAFGELLFHDWLHVVPSPFGGQLVAALLYNAAWMTLIFAVVRRSAGAAQALLFLAVFVLVVLAIEPGFVNGIWFPHQYLFPYAAMLVSIAPLAFGRADTLKALAVSSGFLINGHVAFVPMLGLMLIAMLVANWLASRGADERGARILSRGWMARHGRALLAALGILGLFLVPLLIATVRDFPGPVHDYVAFGRHNKGNAPAAALAFVLRYWHDGVLRIAGPLVALAAALLLVAPRLPRATRDGSGDTAGTDRVLRDMRGIGIAGIAATLALLFYAKVGIDDLNQAYVAYFYDAVPAMAAALVSLLLCRLVPADGRNVVAVLVACALAGVAWPLAERAPGYAYHYDHPGVPELYGWLHALPGSGRIVLDLAPGERFWDASLALMAYAGRRHDDLVCIGAGWHISHTVPGRCRPDEVAANRRFDVRPNGAPDPALGEPDFEGRGLALYRAGAAPRPLRFVTVREQPALFRQLLGQGWSGIEGDYVWSDGPLAHIDLPADPARGRMLTLDLGALIVGDDMRQHAQAFVDGRPAGQFEWSIAERRRRFPIDLGADPGAAKHVVIRIDNPIRPKDHHFGEDTRLLGLSLYGIKEEHR